MIPPRGRDGNETLEKCRSPQTFLPQLGSSHKLCGQSLILEARKDRSNLMARKDLAKLIAQKFRGKSPTLHYSLSTINYYFSARLRVGCVLAYLRSPARRRRLPIRPASILRAVSLPHGHSTGRRDRSVTSIPETPAAPPCFLSEETEYLLPFSTIYATFSVDRPTLAV